MNSQNCSLWTNYQMSMWMLRATKKSSEHTWTFFVHIMKLPILLCNWILHFKTFTMDSCSLPSQISHHALFLPMCLWPSGMEHSKCLTHRKKNERESGEWAEGRTSVLRVRQADDLPPLKALRFAFQMTPHAPAPRSLLSLQGLAHSLINPGAPPSRFTLLWTLHPPCSLCLTTWTPHAAS